MDISLLWSGCHSTGNVTISLSIAIVRGVASFTFTSLESSNNFTFCHITTAYILRQGPENVAFAITLIKTVSNIVLYLCCALFVKYTDINVK